MSDIEIEIDGCKLTAKPNQMVIEVADAAGIYIPRFCYHKHLSIAANCRMCLVDVEKSPKALPACATPVMPGMKVFTKSQKTIDAQRAVMEFLLINHPLDCPVCDQGGECELQDLAMGYGSSHSHFNECKRSVADEDLGPLIATEMTRCIQCTRCVRFGAEVAGLRELGLVNRGEDVEISTYVEEAIKSEVSGNIIDLCPVGALTAKPSRFTARAWELDQSPSVSPHDCIGSNMNVHTRYGKVMRVVSRENVNINDAWISDRDRFSYEGLSHPDRLGKPQIKVNGEWQIVDWQKAFEVTLAGLQKVMNESGVESLAALASPNSTIEEFYLLQKIMRSLGSPHIDHRLREKDTRDQDQLPTYPGMELSLPELDDCDAFIIIGSNVPEELSLVSLRIRKAIQRRQASILVVNPVDYLFNFEVTEKRIVAPQQMLNVLLELQENLPTFLVGKEKVAIILGSLAEQHDKAADIRALSFQIAKKTNGKMCIFTEGANSAGGWLAGAIPNRQAGGVAAAKVGKSAYEMLEQGHDAFILMNIEPDLDCANPSQAVKAMQRAKFIVALSVYKNAVLEENADVILPMSAFTETSGTYVNANGIWQSFKGAANAFEAARPAWKILRVLANFLQLEGFNYETSQAVRDEVKSVCGDTVILRPQAEGSRSVSLTQDDARSLYRIGEVPIYASDSLVRHSKPLQVKQAILQGDLAVVKLHPETARNLSVSSDEFVNVKQQEAQVRLKVYLDERIPLNAAWIAGGIPETAHLGDLVGPIEIKKV